MLSLAIGRSLADTKLPKYIPQNFIRAYFPDDLAEMIQRLTEVLRDQIGRQRRHFQSVADTPESRRCTDQRLIMADIRHQGFVGVTCDAAADFCIPGGRNPFWQIWESS